MKLTLTLVGSAAAITALLQADEMHDLETDGLNFRDATPGEASEICGLMSTGPQSNISMSGGIDYEYNDADGTTSVKRIGEAQPVHRQATNTVQDVPAAQKPATPTPPAQTAPTVQDVPAAQPGGHVRVPVGYEQDLDNPDPNMPDKNGIIYDKRIHSNKPTLTKKGVWRARRNVDDETVAIVEQELRARIAPPAPVGDVDVPVQPAPVAAPQLTPAPAPAPAAAVPPPPPGDVDVPATPQVPAPPVAPPAPAAAVPPPPPGDVSAAPNPPQPVQTAPAPAPAAAAQPATASAPATATGVGDGNVAFTDLMNTITTQMNNPTVAFDQSTIANMVSETAQTHGVQLNAITDVMADQNLTNHIAGIMVRDGFWPTA